MFIFRHDIWYEIFTRVVSSPPWTKASEERRKKETEKLPRSTINSCYSYYDTKEDLEILRNDKPENKFKKQNAIFTNIGYFSCQQGCLVIQITCHRIKRRKSFFYKHHTMITFSKSEPKMAKQFLFKEFVKYTHVWTQAGIRAE